MAVNTEIKSVPEQPNPATVDTPLQPAATDPNVAQPASAPKQAATAEVKAADSAGAAQPTPMSAQVGKVPPSQVHVCA